MAYITLGWADHPPPEFLHGAVSIGNFDGVHRGHHALIQATKRWSKRIEGPAIAITFDPPPVALLNPPALREPLTTLGERAALLEACGADHVIALTTDAALLSLSPEAFFEDVVHRQLQAKAVVEGFNFFFGRARRGDIGFLRHLCQGAGIEFEEVSPFLLNDRPVSSSRVRQAIEEGDMKLTAELLGRTYSIRGRVVQGAQRGRTLGFPTANLAEVNTLLPRLGVYAVRAKLANRIYSAAANIGSNPTFGEVARKIEVHLLDFEGDLYGQTLEVEFVARLRNVIPFANAQALIAQLQDDLSQARRLLV